MTKKIIYYITMALHFVAVPMGLAWLLPVRLMVGIMLIIQLLTLIIVGKVIQQTIQAEKEKE